MVLTNKLISQGFLLENVNIDDLVSYIDVKKLVIKNMSMIITEVGLKTLKLK